MGRPKGSKNVIHPTEEKGNPAFNVTEAEPVDPTWVEVPHQVAPGAMTAEDMELEREINRLAMEQAIPDIEPEPPAPKKNIDVPNLLSNIVPVQAATSVNELNDQVFQAKNEGCDSIEASRALVRHFVKDPSVEKIGYFMYQDIKVYIDGHFVEANKRATRTTQDLERGN